MDVLERNRLMWGPTIGIQLSPFDVVEGAAAGDYQHVSIVAQDIAALGDGGAERLRDHAAQRGVTVSCIDGFYPWQPLGGTKLDGAVCTLDEILAQAEILGARFIGALSLPLGLGYDELAERFAEPSGRCGEAGRVLTIEFSPLGGVPDLAAAAAVVAPSGYGSGGILFDTWHFYRGNPDFDLLETMGPEQIVAVQISDAAAEVRESLWRDTIRYRLQPGDGSFDLPRVVGALERIGALDWYGPEVISTELHAKGPAEAGRLSAERLDEFLTALFPTGGG